MARQDARLSVILAFVFPAIICAAVALAYYGYRYAVAASVRTKASLMEGNQQLAQLLTEQVQDRIDKTDAELFEEVQWPDVETEPPAAVDLPDGVESVALLDETLKIRSIYPVPESGRRRRELERWGSYVRGLAWKSLEPWTEESHGSFRHLHQLFEGRSVLIAYAAKKSETGHTYYVAAKLDLGSSSSRGFPTRWTSSPASGRSPSSTRSGGRSMANGSHRRRSNTRRLSARRSTPGAFKSPRATWRSCAPRPIRNACSACC